MAILYYFKSNNSNDVSMFPPSVLSSDWVNRVNEEGQRRNGVAYYEKSLFILFEDIADLNNYLDTHTLTDEQLLNDISVWKSAHNITYTGGIFDLNPGGGPILSVNCIVPVDIVGTGL